MQQGGAMVARLRLWWQKIRKPLGIIAAIALLAGVLVLFILAGYRLTWTGFFHKTLWDWLQLLGVLAVPVVVGFGAIWFTTRQTRISEANSKQQHDTDLQIAEIQQQEEFLRTYFDRISELLLKEHLLTNENIQSIVRARTLAALHILNTERKAIVLRFLHDASLLQYVKNFLYSLDLSNTDLHNIDLSEANLSGANLSGANLSDARLNNTKLIRADLRNTNLNSANLIRADLSDANLNSANLNNTNPSNADLNNTNPSNADLSRAKLRGANLRRAKLSNTNFSGAEVTEEQLKEAELLKGATLPDGSKHP